VPDHLMLWSGEWARGPRARGSLKRGRDLPEGLSSPQARRRFARGGVHPWSKVEIHPRGMEPSSAAKLSWYDAWPSGETEVRPKGAEAGRLMGC
jgi:hypothetical protein